MKDTGEIRSTDSDSEQNARSEYRFVYNLAGVKKLTFYSFAIAFVFLIILFIGVHFFNPVLSEKIRPGPFFFLIIILTSFFSVRHLKNFSRVSITINREGMTCVGYGFIPLPNYCTWREFAQIRVTTSIWFGRRLVFIRLNKVQYKLPIGSWKCQFYVGVDHSLSLEEAIEKFAGAIERS
jgi:hypothetical protein